MQLHEQYRPKNFDELVGQDKAAAKIKALAKRGLGARAYWISGQSGTGKTTIARLLGSQLAEPMYIEELDATDLSAAKLRDIEQSLAVFGLGQKNGRVVIINEAHGLNKTAIRQLLVMLDRLPSHAAIIFTTTVEGQELLFAEQEDTAPLLSRCIQIELARRDLAKAFAQRAMEIAQKENLDGKPIAAYLTLVQKHRNNMRAVLQSIEAGEMLE
ncbi:MAG: hypothetical protein A2Y07_01220 [Planctomycetes bacterium GWF2_50_10]|nr:MAG: hypothetical protein A2Y07_01220 [Planctomycetes bacterium GWF2_50_10]